MQEKRKRVGKRWFPQLVLLSNSGPRLFFPLSVAFRRDSETETASLSGFDPQSAYRLSREHELYLFGSVFSPFEYPLR